MTILLDFSIIFCLFILNVWCGQMTMHEMTNSKLINIHKNWWNNIYKNLKSIRLESKRV